MAENGDQVAGRNKRSGSGKRPVGEINPAPMVGGRKRGRTMHVSGDGSQSGAGRKRKSEIDGDQDGQLHIFTERERRRKMKDMFNTLHSLLPHLPPKASNRRTRRRKKSIFFCFCFENSLIFSLQTDKSTVIDESVKHIKSLERTLNRLQKQQQQQKTMPPPTFGATPPTSEVSREVFVANQTLNNNNSSSSNNNRIVSALEVPTNFQTWSAPNVVLSISGKDAFISICAMKKKSVLPTIFHLLEEYRLQVITAHVSSTDTNRFMCIIHVHVS